MRLAMSPDGGPSSVVTTPTTSRSPCGVMCTTLSSAGSTWLIAVSVDSDTILPNTSSPVTTMNPTGWIGAVVPGGSTGRWTPRWPPLSRNVRTSAKLPNSGLYTADLAPVGSGVADLGDDQPDVARRDLHPVEALDAVDRPQLEAEARASAASAW